MSGVWCGVGGFSLAVVVCVLLDDACVLWTISLMGSSSPAFIRDGCFDVCLVVVVRPVDLMLGFALDICMEVRGCLDRAFVGFLCAVCIWVFLCVSVLCVLLRS